MTANLFTLNPAITDFILIGLPQQLSEIHSHSHSLPPAQTILLCLSARNLGFAFEPSLSISQQISKLSSSCHYHIRDLHGIRNSLAPPAFLASDFRRAACSDGIAFRRLEWPGLSVGGSSTEGTLVGRSDFQRVLISSAVGVLCGAYSYKLLICKQHRKRQISVRPEFATVDRQATSS